MFYHTVAIVFWVVIDVQNFCLCMKTILYMVWHID